MPSAPSAPKRRSRFLAVPILMAALLAAGFIFLVGFFSDWSGHHVIPTQFIVGPIVIIVVAFVVAAWIWRRGSR